jgi:hypothetical protein
MPQQTIHRGIRKLLFAAWNGVDSYGTAHEMLGARNASLELVVETDELRGDDVVLDRFSKIVAINTNIEVATVDLTWADMVLGGTLVNNADYYNLDFDEDDNPPYVGIAARVAGSSSDGDLHIFVKKARLSGNLALQAQLDTYMTPSATFQGVSDGTSLYQLRNFTAPTALEIPLRTTTGGF